MNKSRILFFFMYFLMLVAPLCSQTHIKTNGARINIPQGTGIYCPGHFELDETQFPGRGLALEGEMVLGGNFINHAYFSSVNLSQAIGGQLTFRNSQELQYLKGSRKPIFTKVILDNPYGLKLDQELGIFQQIHLRQGRIDAFAQRLEIFARHADAISNYSNEHYVIGKLRRYVTVGSTDFPVGCLDSYQPMRIHFDQDPGLLYIDATFLIEKAILTNTVEADGRNLYEFLDNGAWNLYSPQNTSSPFTLSLTSQGHSNGGEQEGLHSFLIDKGMGWESIGQLIQDQTIGKGANPITATRGQITSWGKFAIAKGDFALGGHQLRSIQELKILNNGSTQDQVKLSFQTDSAGSYQVEIRDLRGRILKSWNYFALPGHNENELKLEDLPESIYVLTVKKNGVSLERKIW